MKADRMKLKLGQAYLDLDHEPWSFIVIELPLTDEDSAKAKIIYRDCTLKEESLRELETELEGCYIEEV